MLLGALSDAFHSWNFCWVLEVMLLGTLTDGFDSWNFCWVQKVMFFILGTFAGYKK